MTQELVEEAIQEDVVAVRNNVEVVKDVVSGKTSFGVGEAKHHLSP